MDSHTLIQALIYLGAAASGWLLTPSRFCTLPKSVWC